MARLLADAGALLGTVELVDDLSASHRAAVARVRVDGGKTVIVKQPFEDEARVREIEALRTLPGAVRPALLAVGGSVLVMEDLGEGPSLADLLLGRDAGAAEAALLAWAGTLGTVLAATLRTGPDTEPEDMGDGLHELRRLADDLDVIVPRGVADDAAHIASTLAHPGAWLAFCPGDTCPDNNRVLADGSVRLLDFEGAGWRHAAFEAAYCRVPFCTCWCVARLPEGATARMEAAFLAALSPPEVDRFVDVVALAAAHYTVVSFSWFRRFVLEDRPPGGQGRPVTSSGRQYVYSRLQDLAEQHEQLPALAQLADRLAGSMVARWPDAAAMPLYPAFGG